MKHCTTNNTPNAIPYGYCHCGCGFRTHLAKRNDVRLGHIRGQPTRYLRGHNSQGHFLPVSERFWQKVAKRGPDECWEWQGKCTKWGYGSLYVNGRPGVRAHRVVYELTHGPIPEGKIVCHSCNNPPCCNPKHLYAGTDIDNHKDAVNAGTSYRFPPLYGSSNPSAKLTEDGVRHIRELHVARTTCQQLAKAYHVSSDTIWRIVSRRSWKHVP
jgi:hypothetical protein